ncbi:hypothetical protein N9242_02390 [Vicingaceae bacterium]|nr:hypothetical protein [Vicingaceae bacterium]
MKFLNLNCPTENPLPPIFTVLLAEKEGEPPPFTKYIPVELPVELKKIFSLKTEFPTIEASIKLVPFEENIIVELYVFPDVPANLK